MKGIQRGKSYGSLDDTIITIEADESTHLLVDRGDSNNNCNYYYDSKEEIVERRNLESGLSSWSFGSGSSQSNGSDNSNTSTKTFKSHFTELRVLAFALILLAALTIASYLLIIESRLPSITFSLDLVNHDIWSQKGMSQGIHLQHQNVDHIILMQTGKKNCDTSWECFEILREMQMEDKAEELPYNFLIGGDGLTYEVRGWEYESGMKGVPQRNSLIIGIMGNFDYKTPTKNLIQNAQSLIIESLRRRKVNRKYNVYGLRQNAHHANEGEHLFKEIVKLPKFKGFLLQVR